MFDIEDIHPLTGFLRDHKSHLERLKSTGKPEILTVNGRAKVVVQDALAYQDMVAALDAVETERIIRQRLRSLDRGDGGIAASQVLNEVRGALGIDDIEVQ